MLLEISIDEYEFEKFEKEFALFAQKDELPFIRGLLEGIDRCGKQNINSNERNMRIYKMRKEGATYREIARAFGISIERARQIGIREQRKRDYHNRYEYKRLSPRDQFFSCLMDICEEQHIEQSVATRVCNCLKRYDIIDVFDNGKTLDEFTDEYLLNMRNFGNKQLSIARQANELYKKKQILHTP